MQIKTTLRFYYTPVRMAKIKSSSDNRCWQGCGLMDRKPGKGISFEIKVKKYT